MSATRFSITPESQSLSICGPLFIAEETEAPEGKGLEDGHMAGQGCSEECRRCLTSMGEGGGAVFGPVTVWRGALPKLLRPTMCAPPQKAMGENSIPQASPQPLSDPRRGSLRWVAATGSTRSCSMQRTYASSPQRPGSPISAPVG